MGTRSLTRIRENGKTLVAVYRQYDGYIDGQGKDLAEILKGRKMTNGIRDDALSVFNGAGCLAANIICEMKRPDNGHAGSVYIVPVDDEDQGYTYNIDVISKVSDNGWGYEIEEYPVVTVVRYGKQIFKGTSDEFVEFVTKEEEWDEDDE